jgi:glycosyltransferase involved in cell wall biosynthesis
MVNCAWVTWERQQRNLSMANLLEADYYEFTNNNVYFIRVLKNASKTLSVFRKGYTVVFVQSPSVFLMGFSVFFNLFFRVTLIVDAHNSGIYISEGKYKILNRLNFWFLRRASLVIVSNQKLVKFLESYGIRSIAFPDPLPAIQDSGLRNDQLPHYDIFIVCSWAEDEPIHLYIRVIKKLKHLKFGISGNYTKSGLNFIDMPENLDLLGFIPEKDYFNYLRVSNLIVDLTLRENCLVCGAYEAISVGTPVILTDNAVGREIFSGGVVFSECNDSSFLSSINYALEHQESLIDEIGVTKSHINSLSKLNATRIFEFIKKDSRNKL